MMVTKPKKIPDFYWDSCTHIDLIQHDADRFARLDAWHKHAQATQSRIVISTMVIAEVARLDGSGDSLDAQAKLIEAYFDNPWFVVWEVDRYIASEAARLCRQYPIKPPDAIHLATAMIAKVKAMFTYDDELIRKVNGGVNGISVVNPPEIATQTDLEEAAGSEP